MWVIVSTARIDAPSNPAKRMNSSSPLEAGSLYDVKYVQEVLSRRPDPSVRAVLAIGSCDESVSNRAPLKHDLGLHFDVPVSKPPTDLIILC